MSRGLGDVYKRQLPKERLATFPPVLSLVGSNEAFASNAERLHAALDAAGVPTVMHVAPDQQHGYTTLRRVLPEARDSLNRAAVFIRGVLSEQDLGEVVAAVEDADAGVRWRRLLPAGDAFLETAPVRTRQVLEVAAPPAQLWAALAADDAIVGWSPAVTKTRWTTPRPHGVGTVREVTIGGVVTVRELFHRWDEGHRMTFDVVASTRPGIRRFAEDYVVEETPKGSRLTWIVAMEPAVLPPGGAAVAERALSAGVAELVKGLAARLERTEKVRKAHKATTTVQP